MKRFNVTGLCMPARDYMVDISDKIDKIRNMVDMEEYFTINRARQYGKTTTLQMLKKNLSADYIVSRISFEGIGSTIFSDEANFCLGFDELFEKSLRFSSASQEDLLQWTAYQKKTDNFLRLSEKITDFCTGRKTVLLIDEVDQIPRIRKSTAQSRFYMLDRHVLSFFRTRMVINISKHYILL